MAPIKKSYFLASHHEGLHLFNCIHSSDVGSIALIQQKWDFCPETSLFPSHNYFAKHTCI